MADDDERARWSQWPGSFIAGLAAGERPSPTAGEPARFELGWLTRAGFPAVRNMADAALFLEGYGASVSQRVGDRGPTSPQPSELLVDINGWWERIAEGT